MKKMKQNNRTWMILPAVLLLALCGCSSASQSSQSYVEMEQYDEAKARVEQLIAEATQKGMLEPDMDNDYTREISLLSQQMATYEDEYLNVLPLRQKSPLISMIEDYFYTHGMKQKDGAKLLGVNESQFSQIMSGRRRISMSFAKRLHSKLGINADLILEYA
jgi:antitoxin component HigA of HigAB toxin-antitoxin module